MNQNENFFNVSTCLPPSFPNQQLGNRSVNELIRTVLTVGGTHTGWGVCDLTLSPPLGRSGSSVGKAVS